MEQSNPTKYWWLSIIRGLIYIAIGASMLFVIRSFTEQWVQFIGSLLIAAGVFGSFYAFYTLRADRNYFWELLRCLFDIGFGLAFLIYLKTDPSGFGEILGFWAVLFAFIQAVQAMYIFMLSGIKQPRNIFGNVLHFLNILLAGGIAYSLVGVPIGDSPPVMLIGFLMAGIGLIIILLVVQQRQTLLINKPA